MDKPVAAWLGIWVDGEMVSGQPSGRWVDNGWVIGYMGRWVDGRQVSRWVDVCIDGWLSSQVTERMGE